MTIILLNPNMKIIQPSADRSFSSKEIAVMLPTWGSARFRSVACLRVSTIIYTKTPFKLY